MEKIARTLEILAECVQISSTAPQCEAGKRDKDAKLAARFSAARRLIHQIKTEGKSHE